MKYSSSARGRVARFLSIMFAASLLSGLMSSFAARAQSTEPTPAPSAATQPSAEEAAKREAWRAIIARTPLPKKGCFTALYPSTEWQEAPCGPPSQYPNRPQPHGGHGLHRLDAVVGDRNDYSAQVFHPGNLGGTFEHSAQVSGSISSAVGSFDSVTPATITESGPWWTQEHCPPPDGGGGSCRPTEPCIHPDHGGGDGGNVWCTVPTANAFTLQLNTHPFLTTACQGGAECYGWQQFIFSQDQCNGPCVFMEYWLLNFGASCPTSPPLSCPPGQTQPPPTQWTPDGQNDCWFNSCSMPAPAVSAAQLQETTLTGTAAGDGDTVVLTTAGGTATAMAADSALNLAQAWNTVEWNVFGDSDGFQANFSPGSTIVVRTSVNSGANIDCNVQICDPPLCVQEGFTGEMNNLFLVGTPALVPPSTLPAIVFTESNAADRTPASCTGTLGNISGGPPPPRQP
jgi:hypothetical protein